MATAPPYPCPCCGYLTLERPPAGYDLCPICGWEDADRYDHRSNRVTLRQAQRTFLASGACEPAWLGTVRAPTGADRRPTDWRTLDERAAPVIRQVATAFRDVARGDGVTLHEARAIDDDGSAAERRAARAKDPEVRWQDVPDSRIATLSDVLTFLDPAGFRFYIPAYMSWTLANFMISPSMSVDSTIYALLGGETGFAPTRAAILSEEQARAIGQFLRFMVEHADGYADVDAAQAALDRHWGQFAPVTEGLRA